MKHRGDSRLKTLPEERQRAIMDLLKSGTIANTKKQLALDGLVTSLAALSEFYSWYQLRQAFQQAESDTLNMLDLIKHDLPELPPDKVSNLGETLFNMAAIRLQDPKLFLAMQTARHEANMDKLRFDQKERELQLSEKKFQRETCELFLKWSADQRANQISHSTSSNSEKIQQLGALMFGENWQ